jgi:hypothetical protein
MDERVMKLKTPEECEVFARNVAERGRSDLAQQAVKRAVELRAASYGAKTMAEQECLRAIYAYEELLTKKNGRRTKASRTWQMIHRHGILPAAERAVNREAPTQGYKALIEMGLQEYAFEAVILRYPKLFSPEAVRRSTERMKEWGGTK